VRRALQLGKPIAVVNLGDTRLHRFLDEIDKIDKMDKIKNADGSARGNDTTTTTTSSSSSNGGSSTGNSSSSSSSGGVSAVPEEVPSGVLLINGDCCEVLHAAVR
jgi:hypothetical protein